MMCVQHPSTVPGTARIAGQAGSVGQEGQLA